MNLRLQVEGEAVEDPNDTDDRLIDLIYMSLLGESSWNEFLGALSATMPGGKSTLFFHNVDRNEGTFSLSFGLESSEVEAYDQHFSRLNPWMAKAAIRPIGVGVVAEQMLDRSDLVGTEFYHDFLRPAELESAVGVTITRECGRSFLLSTMTSRSDADANMANAARLGKLAPHLRRAFDHYRRGPTQRAILQIGDSIFHSLDTGVLIVGENLQLKAQSPTAQMIVEKSSGIQISAGNAIVLADRDRMDTLKAMVSRVHSGPSTMNWLIDATERPIRVTCVRVSKDRISAYFEGPTAVVILEPVGWLGGRFDDEVVARTYGLTKAETRVLRLIQSGMTVVEAARSSNVSKETVRTQLKNIFRKVGVTSQMALLRKVGGV